MADVRKPIYIAIVLLCLHPQTSESSKEDLDGAEANGKLEIVKQIKKVNDDGTYTIGYEADDGSFKIESRDVLGNVKGTYGYVDENGEIKRVSYSTNNSSEIIPKTESSSVVQRIPKTRSSSTTRSPIQLPTTQATLTSITAQTTPRRRTTTMQTTTTDSNYSDFIKAAVKAAKVTTSKAPPVYIHSEPARVLLQSRSVVKAQEDAQKSEGQLIRPDVAPRPTDVPIYKRPLKTLLDSESKPVTEESDARLNLLRRQLNPEKNDYDPRQHLLTLQQSSGSDVVDVYSASVTTGAPRPLFTTSRPRFVSTGSTVIPRPTVRYQSNYPKQIVNSDYTQESATTESVDVPNSTINPVPIVQIPANRVPQEMLVAIPHPVHGRTVLVPFNQLRNKFSQVTDENEQFANEQFLKEPQQSYPPSPISVPVYVRRYMSPKPLRVQVDENGFVREMHYANPTPYSTPIPIPNYISPEDEINLIKPPVSTQDFQKLLEQLIFRQSRLEQISRLMEGRRYEFGQRYKQIYQTTPVPVFARRPDEQSNYRYVQGRGFGQETSNQDSRHYNQDLFTPTAESFTPTRRVARLLKPRQREDEDDESNYLPPDVREMLLLRMLQLAINPGLPLDIPDNFEEGTSTVAYHKKGAVRNVEILGEEEDGNTTKRKR